MSLVMTPQEKKVIDTIRALSMDGVQKAKSGHPGTAMALAPVAYLLYNEVMDYDPARPDWLNRDRFVLSIGHASILLYSILHLAGVSEKGAPAVTMDDLKSFRQLGSRCAGHPEYGLAPGIEMTTGPLGAGLATSVGMAMAERWLAERYNRPGSELFSYRVYALCGDGCMMEGISSEAASLAGHLKLGNLCWIYDDNNITIEGETSLAFSESVDDRFRAYGWNVIRVGDVNDLPSLRAAFAAAEAETSRPSLIIVKSRIAFGAPTKEGKESAHGAPLGEDEIRGAKKFYGFPEEESFRVEPDVYETFKSAAGARGVRLSAAWDKTFADYAAADAAAAKELKTLAARKLPEGWDGAVETFPADVKGMASRASSGKVLNQIAAGIPWLVGGSADLAPSNNTFLKFDGAGEFAPGRAGRNVHFGVRENAMAAAANGLTLSGLRGYCATFFVFSDYLRPMVRLAALMKLPTLFVFTHDSIGVGEDGPTHQPIEHLAALRAIPGVKVFRPADANEVAESYRAALEISDAPSVLVLTRQNLPTLDRALTAPASGVRRGAYILRKEKTETPDVILIGTGSEVALCLAAAEKLEAEGVAARVVSMPCQELFELQSAEYKESVLPAAVGARLAVELGVRQGWDRYLGFEGKFLGMEGFGASAPAGVLMEHFGFTAERLTALAKEVIQKK
ncbi:MAG: transketolase [Thermoguttaceae bacterium]|nr:transketolase [Thermoguttaceae bacterium]